MIKRSYLFFIFLFLTNFLFAQQHRLIVTGNDAATFLSITKIEKQFISFVECQQAINEAHHLLLNDGYLTHSIDSVQTNDSSTYIHVTTGKKYIWAQLKNKNIPPHILTQSGFEAKKFFNKKVEINKLTPLFEKIIIHFENNGYPFASLSLDSVTILTDNNHEKVSGYLNLETGPYIKMDTVLINEEANISHHYVTRYLGIKEKNPYSESKINNINNRIKESSFLQISYPWRMDFTSTSNKLNLYLKTKSANRADVLIGLLPNNLETGGKFLLTGDVKLFFINTLEQGESLQINWQNMQYKSPRYNIQFVYPYFLNTPFGITTNFDFYKKDTSYRNINAEIGLLYYLNAGDKLKFYYELSSSRLGSINTAQLIASRKLPANADVAYKKIGLEFLIQKTDYLLNPRKGFKILLNGGVSTRNIIKNSIVENTYDPIAGKNFSYLYDTMKLKSFKYNFFAAIHYFIPLSKRLITAAIYHTGITFSTQQLYRNELFQIGGYRLLRGFDEGSIFANHYQLFTVEPRYLLSLNSYFYLFTDVGYVQSKFTDIFIKNTPISFGFGMAFESKAGLFNISYGVGKNKNQPLELKNSKIHFGYESVF